MIFKKYRKQIGILNIVHYSLRYWNCSFVLTLHQWHHQESMAKIFLKEDKKSLVSTETESINSGEKQDEFQQIKGDKKHTSLLLHDDEAQSQHGNGVCTDYIRRNAIALKSGYLSRDQPFCLCFLPTSLRCSGVVPFRILPWKVVLFCYFNSSV